MNSQYEILTSKRKGRSVPSYVVNLLQSAIIILSIFIVIYLFIFTPNVIEGDSMNPSFTNGQMILTNKLVNWFGDTQFGKSLDLVYKKGDTIVFQKPGLNVYIKRIIAMPGERVAIRDGYVYVDSKRILEEYLLPATFTKGSSFIEDGGESKVVPENEYFVMGDNRNNSLDSRYNEIGFVKKEWLKGKVALIYWPIGKLGIVNTGKIEVIN